MLHLYSTSYFCRNPASLLAAGCLRHQTGCQCIFPPFWPVVRSEPPFFTLDMCEPFEICINHCRIKLTSNFVWTRKTELWWYIHIWIEQASREPCNTNFNINIPSNAIKMSSLVRDISLLNVWDVPFLTWSYFGGRDVLLFTAAAIKLLLQWLFVYFI